MSWILRLSQWFAPQKRGACIGVTSDDRERVRQEQRELADEIESLFRVFDDRLQQLAQRAHGLSAAEFNRESSQIRGAQDELRRTLRRLEASVKSTAQLERELEQWEQRSTNGKLHADHPSIRAEVIRSELAVRNGTIRVNDISQRDARPVKEVVDLIKQQLVEEEMSETLEDENVEPEVSTEYQFRSVESLPEMDPQFLIRAIQEATREAEQWHGVPVTMMDEDALVQMHHVRDLHAVLKRIDRARGVQRDRVAMAMTVRGLK